MRNKIVMLSFALTMTFSLTACTVDLSPLMGHREDTEIVEVEAEVLLTENQKEIKRLEQVYASGEFESADVMNLARLYREEGFVKKSRDIYEVAYRIYEDEQALAELSKITVNLLEEDEEIVAAVEGFVMNMKTPEYFGEAIYSLFSEEWFDTMMPKMPVGQRSYYLEGVKVEEPITEEDGEGQVSIPEAEVPSTDTAVASLCGIGAGEMLRITVSYDEDGSQNGKVFLENNGALTMISKDKAQLQVMQTGIENENYSGAFTAWTLSVETGEIIREDGTFADGKYVGDYEISIFPGYGQSDLLSLWNMRESMDMTTYYGNFGEDGVSTLEQQGDNEVIIYAYTEDGKGYLSIPAPMDENGSPVEMTNYSFGASTFGLPDIPMVEKYDIAKEVSTMIMGADSIPTIKPTEEPKVSVSDLQVRVFDGEVQVFDGTKWTSFGSVEKMASEDIIAIKESVNATQAPVTEAPLVTTQPSATASPSVSSGGSREQGIVATPTPKPTATPKPKPKPTAAPTAAPTVAPTQAPSGGGSSSGGSSSGGSSGSSTPSQPGTPSQPSTPSEPSTPSNPGDSGSSGGGSSDGGGDSSGGQDIEDGWSDIIQ